MGRAGLLDILYKLITIHLVLGREMYNFVSLIFIGSCDDGKQPCIVS